MRHLFLLFCCLFCYTLSFAQLPKPTFSEPFEEPDALDSKVVQCPNGNTFLFAFNAKEGIDVTVFDKSRKQIATQKLSGGDVWDVSIMKKSQACAIYPMNDQIVIFLQQLDEKAPVLYRIILSDKDGKLVKEEKIAEMPKYSGGAGYAMAFGHVQPKNFYVERDTRSNDYAVVAFDGFAEETAKRIELIHYDSKHNELGRSFYDAPENRFKYINYLGMAVNGTHDVSLATYCFNTPKSGGGSKIILSNLVGSTLTHHPLSFTRDLKDTKALLVYNHVKKILELLTLSEVSAKESVFSNERKVYYTSLLVAIDPETFSVLSSKTLTDMMATKYRKTHYDKDENRYTGLPMNLIINPDGSTTVISEDEILVFSTGGRFGLGIDPGIGLSGMSSMPGSVKSVTLHDAGITDYDQNGNELNGYVVRKSQKLAYIIPPLEHNDMRNNRVTFDQYKNLGTTTNSGFYSYDYISTPSGRYVIFNDHPKNFERDAEKNPKLLEAVSDANAICYKLTNGEMSKQYLFGAPDDSFENRFALITSGDYSEATGDYAVLMIEKTGRKEKAARIAWEHLK